MGLPNRLGADLDRFPGQRQEGFVEADSWIL